MKYNLVFLDTETTGKLEEDRLVQVSYRIFGQEEIIDEMFKPPIPIKVDSMEVTHITNRMVADKPPFIGSSTEKSLKDLFADPLSILVAHNAIFDLEMLAKEGLVIDNYIDTLKVARYLDTDAKLEAYRLQYLRYLLDLDAEIDQPIQAHDAKGDVLVLERLFLRLFSKVKESFGLEEDKAVAKMLDISKNPIEIKKFTFGKYVGRLISEVAKEDLGYLEWLLNQKESAMESRHNDEDWIFTLKKFVNK